jgi:hypothetical protein
MTQLPGPGRAFPCRLWPANGRAARDTPALMRPAGATQLTPRTERLASREAVRNRPLPADETGPAPGPARPQGGRRLLPRHPPRRGRRRPPVRRAPQDSRHSTRAGTRYMCRGPDLIIRPPAAPKAAEPRRVPPAAPAAGACQ